MDRKIKLGIIIPILQLVISIIFLVLIFKLDIIPNKYLIPMVIVLFALEVLTLYTHLSNKGEKLGKYIAVFLCIIMVFGSYYLYKTQVVLKDISGVNIKVNDISVIVMKEDPAQSIEELTDYLFGIQKTIDRENGDKALHKIREQLGTEVKVLTFNDFDTQVGALYNGEIGAILINEAYRDTIVETFKDFNDRTRVIESYRMESLLELATSNIKVIEDSFNVYISGIDTYGPIRNTGRSDVNIIATINPKSKYILLTSTPRDYYLPLPISRGMEDKLTHAGIYGIDVSIGTLEELYDIDIDYYVRVNFTTLEEIIDALGGITVYSQYEFSSGGYNFKKGYNDLNGKETLAFSRERYSFASGDNQRGKNQMEVIKGMIKKATSPAIIIKYNNILNSISGTFETNMSLEEITSLIKMQINDMSPWKVETNSVVGEGARKSTYSYKSKPLYVMIPNVDSVKTAKEKINKAMEMGR